MIIKLKDGESLNHIAKISGMTVDEIVGINGYLPQSGQYFYIDRKNKYVISLNDTLFTVSHKTHLSFDEILNRTTITPDKVIYY